MKPLREEFYTFREYFWSAFGVVLIIGTLLLIAWYAGV